MAQWSLIEGSYPHHVVVDFLSKCMSHLDFGADTFLRKPRWRNRHLQFPILCYEVVLTVVMLIGNVDMSLFEKTIIKKV